VFTLAKDHATDPTATRVASREMMFDRTTGKVVEDKTLVMKLSELRTRIAGSLGAQKAR
jgi:hypothetical protein